MSKWTTSNGTVMEYSEMDSDHLRNCILMLEKKIVDPYDVHGYENGAESGFVHYQIMEDNTHLEDLIRRLQDELDSRIK